VKSLAAILAVLGILALAACGAKHSTDPPSAKASAHAEASALASAPAVLAAEASLAKCQTRAEHAAHPVATFHTCFKAAFPRGHGKALLRCVLVPVAAYYASARTPADLRVLNAKTSTCAEQHP
jgi:hypothetical protein